MKFTKSSLPAWKKNEPLSKYSYIKLGGPADFFTVVKSADELAAAVIAAEEAGLPWFILGGGSNILVGDLGFRGLVIKNEAEGIRVDPRYHFLDTLGSESSLTSSSPPGQSETNVLSGSSSLSSKMTSSDQPDDISRYSYLIAESGVKMAKLAAFANQQGLGGLEVFMSVPGTLGGAIFNNSHYRPRKNEFIGNLVEEAEIMVFGSFHGADPRYHFLDTLGQGPSLTSSSPPGQSETKVLSGSSSLSSKMTSSDQPVTVSRDWFNFGYDYSRLQDEKAVVLWVKFRLRRESPEILRERSLVLMKDRNSHQPIGSPSCGCMFKNYNGVSAGKLIDGAGLKGTKVGGVSVSDAHANFMVNDGSAKVSDVLELMNLVKNRVKEFHGIDLEPEIFMVGEFSKRDPNIRIHPNDPNTLG